MTKESETNFKRRERKERRGNEGAKRVEGEGDFNLRCLWCLHCLAFWVNWPFTYSFLYFIFLFIYLFYLLCILGGRRYAMLKNGNLPLYHLEMC